MMTKALGRTALVSISIIAALYAIAMWGQALPKPATPEPILTYIDRTWATLTRSNKDLAKAAVDPKFKPDAQGKWAVYVPAQDNLKEVTAKLKHNMPAAAFKTLSLMTLPENTLQVKTQGLLYLPFPYVVPGGRFNEMYGWDSYFIQVGLLRDNKIDLARDMANNFLYEVQYYGKVLNANRTYYLTRSQPPFLTQMVLNVYARIKDKQWLSEALPWIVRYHTFYTEGPHLTGTGLSRYFDLGEGPAPEVLSAERNAQGLTHYDLVREYLRTHKITDYDVSQYYDRASNTLKPLFYKGDRTMRESGFDPSNRFGPFDLDIIHYDPVCLNSLLYIMEMQIGDILDLLGRRNESGAWREKARVRAGTMNRLMWAEPDGLYFDYDFQTKHVRKYPFLTTFYPLWAGLASKQQAAEIEKNLRLFEKKGGLQTSTDVTGNQWDAPFGWAPLEMIAVNGLRKYGYAEDANRISVEFLRTIRQNYLRQGYIVEKYDVVDPLLSVSSQIHFGYSSNEAGFGWTNAAFTDLYDQLPPADQRAVMSNPQ
jgi:alpha,alpha-trehalase